MFYPIHTANLNAINALGRSDIFLRLEVIKKVYGLIILFSTMWFGVKIMAYSCLLTSFLGQIINSSPNKKLLDYGYIEQCKDILPGILLAFLVGLLVSLVNFLSWPDWQKILLQVPSGVMLFVFSSKILHLESYKYMKSLFCERLFCRRAAS